MEARDARQSNWLGRSTVRSLRLGTAFDLIGLPSDPTKADTEHRYDATDITHLGINNLSGEAIAAIAQRLGQGHLNTDGEGLSTGDNFTPASAPDELWCDALGQVKIRFHWQQAEAKDDRDSCWVRVLNRQAGTGMGWQWLPRCRGRRGGRGGRCRRP